MFSLVRSGPKMLLFKTPDANALKNALIHQFEACVCDLEEAFERATEDYTILFIAEAMEATLRNENIQFTLVVLEEPERLLCRIFKTECLQLITEMRTAPKIILLRAIGDLNKVLTHVQSDFGGSLGSFTDLMESGNADTTLICLTEKPLNRNMSTKDLYPQVLRLDNHSAHVYKSLRMQALKYLNIGIENRDWNEIEIRIFDRYSAYELHYERLLELFESLEVGIVLGESWSKDYPRLFMSVEVYRVRFFTFHEPVFIKRLLLGMEYLEDGSRMVDYDVYVNHKKIGWTDALNKDDPRSRALAGMKVRHEIMARLTRKDISDLAKLEAAIIKTRT